MVDFTALGTVAEQGACVKTDTRVESDALRKAEDAPQDPLPQSGKGPSAVAFQPESALEAPDGRLEASSDRRQMMNAVVRLVCSSQSREGAVQALDGGRESRAVEHHQWQEDPATSSPRKRQVANQCGFGGEGKR